MSTMLVDPTWLRDRTMAGSVVVLDLRRPDRYASGHIPGARMFPWQGFQERSGALKPPAELAKHLGESGIGREMPIVLYDDQAGIAPSWVYFILDTLGHPEASVLDGGIHAWAFAGLPLTGEVPPSLAPTTTAFGGDAAAVVGERLATRDDVCRVLGRPSEAILVDARTEGEFTGEEQYAARGGHIPGAIHDDFQNAIDRTSPVPRWKAPEKLRADLAAHGVTPEATREVIVYCQSGGRSAHAYITLKRAGFPKVRNYTGSFGEWGNDQTLPVER